MAKDFQQSANIPNQSNSSSTQKKSFFTSFLGMNNTTTMELKQVNNTYNMSEEETKSIEPKVAGTPWRGLSGINEESYYWLPDFWWEMVQGGLQRTYDQMVI
jgi:hypothetical protein